MSPVELLFQIWIFYEKKFSFFTVSFTAKVRLFIKDTNILLKNLMNFEVCQMTLFTVLLM